MSGFERKTGTVDADGLPGRADAGPAGHFRFAADFGLGVLMLLAVGAVTLVPVVFVVIESFNTAGIAEPYKFGLAGWQQAFSSPKTLSAIGYSFLLSIRIPIALAIAFVIAWLLIRVRIPGSRLIEHILWFSFFLPLLPVAIGWILLLDSGYGLLNLVLEKLPFIHGPVFSIYSVPGIIWVHLSLATVPVMVILLAPALRQLDAANEEAAVMSGAGNLLTLFRVTIPLIAPAILTAFIAGFIRSLEVFEVEQLLGTPAGIQVYATRIYDLISSEPPLYPQAMALSSFFLLILLVMTLLHQRQLGRLGGRATITGKGVRLRPALRAKWHYLATALLGLYIAFSIGLPLVMLLLGSFNRLFGFFFIADPWTLDHWIEAGSDPDIAHAALNSTVIGLAAALIGTLLYALIAWALVRTRLWGRGVISLLIWLPWAIPGVVLGLTLSTILLEAPVLSALYGTSVPLVLALIVKSMPIGVQMLRTSIGQVSQDIEEAAAMSGAGFPLIFRRITLPLIAPMCVAIFLLVFMATLTDISTVVLLASPGSRTLSLLMFQFSTSSRPESAAVVGIIIATLSLFITSIAFRIGITMNPEH